MYWKGGGGEGQEKGRVEEKGEIACSINNSHNICAGWSVEEGLGHEGLQQL